MASDNATVSDNTIQLDDDTLAKFAALTQDDDETQWAFGDLLAAVVDQHRDELRAEGYKPKLIREAIADIRRQAAQAGGVTRSCASDRENMARFYEPADRTELNFTYHQFRAIKCAKAEWRTFVDHILQRAAEFGGTVATPEAIREEWKRISGKVKDDDPVWVVCLRRAVNVLDTARRDGGTPDTVREVCREVADKLAETLPEEQGK